MAVTVICVPMVVYSQSLSIHVKPGPGSGGRGGDGAEGVGEELVEVCGDMMSRFTYSNLSTLPSR